ncbi:Pantoate--beta-alanine ligase [Apostasia shenzhenica]|uniref:Pantoate--beta-alanine ligase n=1 Tax=Apostasia shenzhenica TaxID=1088818 RepID=A0A2H9ZWR9_9ASPA|nr:Pantoate--beta-alanine ligase [Apostasia shenzhenica]
MSAPEVFREKSLMRAWSRSHRFQGKTLALVPTMGFLHEGHLFLVRTAKSLADVTVVSIYVNPGQFAPSEDLASYPSDLAGDLRKLSAAGADAVFCPADLYNSSPGDLPIEGEAASCLEDDGSGHETWIRVEM